MKVKIKQLEIQKDKRIICISDIHGSLSLFKQLLLKVNFCKEDILVLIGDLYLKGSEESYDTLKYIMELSKSPNVYVIRGNCDITEDKWIKELNNPPFMMTDKEKEWVEDLPHVIESESYIFVHGGLTSNKIDPEEDAFNYMKNDNFMNKGFKFLKYVVTGHWPVANYRYKIKNNNPLVNEELGIIAIDGGNVIGPDGGQLNAFIIEDNKFSYDFVDNYPVIKIEKSQEARGGNLNVTWLDRFVEILEKGLEFSLCKHIESGQTIEVPNSAVFNDSENRSCAASFATDYYLPVNAGDTVSVIKEFSDRIFAKKEGISGWIDIS